MLQALKRPTEACHYLSHKQEGGEYKKELYFSNSFLISSWVDVLLFQWQKPLLLKPLKQISILSAAV
jgi:hypothetical protein